MNDETFDLLTVCPECGAEIAKRGCMLSEIVDCDMCGMEYEVVSGAPVRLEKIDPDEDDYGE